MNDCRRRSLSSRSVTIVVICCATWLGALGYAAWPPQDGPASPKENPNKHETGDRSDGAAGDEIVDDYVKVLAATGVS